MPGIVTGTGHVPVNLQGYYDRNLLERAVPLLLHDRFGQVRPVPAKSGTRINFRRYNSLAVATNPLTEGTTPTGKRMAVSDIYATLHQYGDFVTISDWLEMTGLDNNLVEAGEVLGEQAGETLDIINRDVLIAGTTVRYASGVSARASVVAKLLNSDIDSVVRTLEANNARKIREMVSASTKVNTRAISPAFIAITHPHCRYDIENLTGFTPVRDYAAQGDVIEGELGAVGPVRFVLSTNAKIVADGGGSVGTTGLVSTSASNIDVYITLVLGRNAYGVVPLQRKSIKNIIKQMGSAGTEDPLDQRATSGWKAATACRILNDDFMARIEHGVTSL